MLILFFKNALLTWSSFLKNALRDMVIKTVDVQKRKCLMMLAADDECIVPAWIWAMTCECVYLQRRAGSWCWWFRSGRLLATAAPPASVAGSCWCGCSSPAAYAGGASPTAARTGPLSQCSEEQSRDPVPCSRLWKRSGVTFGVGGQFKQKFRC